MLRTVDEECDGFDVAILELSRVDDVNDAARRMLAGMHESLTAAGKEGYVVDPDGTLAATDAAQARVFGTLDGALRAAQSFQRTSSGG